MGKLFLLYLSMSLAFIPNSLSGGAGGVTAIGGGGAGPGGKPPGSRKCDKLLNVTFYSKVRRIRVYNINKAISSNFTKGHSKGKEIINF